MKNNIQVETIGGLKVTALFWLVLAVAFAVGIPAALPKNILAISSALAAFLSTLCLIQFVRVATWKELAASIAAHKLGWLAAVVGFALAMAFMFAVMGGLELLAEAL